MKSGHCGPQSHYGYEQHYRGKETAKLRVPARSVCIYGPDAQGHNSENYGAHDNRYAAPEQKFESADSVGHHCFSLDPA